MCLCYCARTSGRKHSSAAASFGYCYGARTSGRSPCPGLEGRHRASPIHRRRASRFGTASCETLAAKKNCPHLAVINSTGLEERSILSWRDRPQLNRESDRGRNSCQAQASWTGRFHDVCCGRGASVADISFCAFEPDEPGKSDTMYLEFERTAFDDIIEALPTLALYVPSSPFLAEASESVAGSPPRRSASTASARSARLFLGPRSLGGA